MAGRGLSDRPTPCEVVASDGFADFGLFEPEVGAHIMLGSTRCQVVGVAAPIREGPLTTPRPVLYRAFTPERLPSSLWILAAARPGQTIAPDAIARAVTVAGSDITVEQLPLSALIDRATVNGRFYSTVLSVASARALGLVVVSVFSLLSHAVRSRRRELAIRTALGGSWFHVGWVVARRVMIGLFVGTVAGLGMSYGALQVVSHLSTISTDAASGSWAMAVGLLWLSALLAALTPVASAVRLHPSAALKDAP